MSECEHVWVLVEDAEGADEFINYFSYWECELCGDTTDTLEEEDDSA